MPLEKNIEETALRVCDAMAGAIELYASVSGSGTDDLPEHFIPAHVLTTLGPVLTMTMETNGSKLWERNCRVRRRWNGLPVQQSMPVMPPDYARRARTERADLVICERDYSRSNETDFLCLVEFKTWKDVEPDVRKIREWLEFIDTCPWGMACGFAYTDAEDWLKIIRDKSESSGDKLVHGRVARPIGMTKTLQTYARVFPNSNYRGPGA